MATEPDAEAWWWWLLAVAVAVTLAALVPIAIAAFRVGGPDGKQRTDGGPTSASGTDEMAKHDAVDGPIEDEPWAPKLEVVDWQAASEMPGCPWNFDDCEGLPEALEKIWRKPLCADLQSGFDALKPRVKKLRVAKICIAMPRGVHFSVVYTLNTGAELFGGAPVEHAVGLDLGDVCDEPVGLRRRRGGPSPTATAGPEAFGTPLPCLLPFYRIHDGFGVLLAVKHLPLLMASPGDTVAGSCFYVYPARGLEPVALRSNILKFARVDKSCVACARAGVEEPNVIYVERNGEQIEEDEHPLSFIADTVSNIAGQRVVPAAYMGGPQE